MIVISRRGDRGVVVEEAELKPGATIRGRGLCSVVACRVRDDRDSRAFYLEVCSDYALFDGAGNSDIWPKDDAKRARAFAGVTIGDALDAATELRSTGREARVLYLEAYAIDEARTPPATNAEIREYLMLKAAWAHRLGARACSIARDDAWRLGVRIELLHDTEQLLIDAGLLTREGPRVRPTLELINRFESGQIGHAPPLLASVLDRISAPRYAAVHEQVMKALDAFHADKQDLADAALSAVRAVEALGKIVTGQPTVTLGKVIKDLRKSGNLREPLDKTFEAIYGFRNSRPGLGHAGVVPSDTELREATFVYNVAGACLLYLLDLDRPGT